MPTRPVHHTAKPCITKRPMRKKVGIAPSPPSPPRLELSPLLLKTWEVVRSAEEAEGRMLAPLTGSTLEAQLLIHRVEVCVFVDEIGGWIV
jgi:hypothetical protein